MSGPLCGVRVLDFSRLAPGPHCTSILAGLGAEVIKVEDPRRGDLLRYFPPHVNGQSVLFTELNRGKQSIAIDLKRAEGQAIVQALARQCDVVLESFRPGVTGRLGIDFPILSSRNPRLVYCSISGFGQDGLHRDLPGHDLTYAAMSGLLDALSPGAPIVPGVQFVDAATAMVAAIRIGAALRGVERGPQYIDVSLTDASRMLMPGALVEAAAAIPGPSLGAALRGSVRYDLYRCSDGRWLALTPLEDHFWEHLVTVLRRDGLLGADAELTSDKLHEIFSLRTCDAWFDLLSREGVPCAPVRTLEEVTAESATEPLAATDKNSGLAPALGEHTVKWLTALGYSQEQQGRLRGSHIVASP